MKIIWIFNEGSPGHLSQSIGFCDVLKQLYPVQVVEVFGRTTLRGWQRHLLRFLIGKNGRPISLGWLSRIADIRVPENLETPDLIVSSGGKSVFAAYAYALFYQIPYVFIGERKPYPSQWFHAVFSPSADEVDEKTHLLDLIPTPASGQLRGLNGGPENRTWCMIIGGRSRSFPFCRQDWAVLAQRMNQLAERENIRWLVTTSRRTGLEAERVLQRELNPDIIKDAIWWAAEPRRELYSFMSRSERLFVTQDSITMVTEAIASGCPVVTIRHPRVKFSRKSFLPGYYKRLIEKKYIQSVLLGELVDVELFNNENLEKIDDELKEKIREVFTPVW
jgi:mitochondrial fission protein ELM1